MVNDVVARAKAALEGVTAGPWVNTEDWAVISSGPDSVLHGYFEGSCPVCGDEIEDRAYVAISIEDLEFIAAARTLVPELVAEVERLHSWDGLMSLLDELTEGRDTGPWFLSQLYQIHQLRQWVKQLREAGRDA